MPEPKVIEAEAPAEGVEDVTPETSEAIAKMSREELDEKVEQFEAEASGEKIEPKPKEKETPAPKAEGKTSKAGGDKPGEEEEPAKAEDTPAKPKEGGEEEVPAEGADKKEEKKEEEEAGLDDAETLKAQIAKQDADNRSLQLRLDRQGNELGLLRRRSHLSGKRRKMSDEEFDEGIRDDPRGTLERENEDRRLEQEEADLEREETIAQGRSHVDSHIPDLAALQADMAKVAEIEGISAANVDLIKTDPYKIDPHDLVDLARRTRSSLRIQTLEIENELHKRSKTSVGDAIDKAVKSPKLMSGGSGQAAGGGSGTNILSSEEIAGASVEDLNTRLKTLRKEETG